VFPFSVSFSCKSHPFSYERFRVRIHLETEAQSNFEVAYWRSQYPSGKQSSKPHWHLYCVKDILITLCFWLSHSPKSANFNSPLSFIKRFCGLRSLQRRKSVVRISITECVCQFKFLSLSLSICLSIYLSVCCLSICWSVLWYIYLGCDLELHYFRGKLSMSTVCLEFAAWASHFQNIYWLSRQCFYCTPASFLRNLSCRANENFDKEFTNYYYYSNFNWPSEKQQLMKTVTLLPVENFSAVTVIKSS